MNKITAACLGYMVDVDLATPKIIINEVSTEYQRFWV
jgi:hypothetical protein